MFDFLRVVLLGIAYRIRGGGWFTFGSNVPCRILWSFSLALAALSRGASLYEGLALVPLAYASMYIPHACYQNMGRWATPQKSWPAFFLPTYNQTEWTSLSLFKKTLNDFIGMGTVGFLRGLLISAPFAVFGHLFSAIALLTIITIGNPIAYLLGFYIPVTITSSLVKFSATYGELLTGMAYGVAICLAI